MRTLLLDSDIIAFKFSAISQDVYTWPDDEEPIVVADQDKCFEGMDHHIAKLMEDHEADNVIVCLTCREANWRDEFFPSYKSNRSSDGRPELLTPAKDYLVDNYRSFLRYSLEADDIMGILSTHPFLVDGEKIIVSEDKDMQTIPGWLHNPNRDAPGEVRKISRFAADRFHLWQTLTGDTTDGYPGCPGVGPVAADDVLDDPFIWTPYEHEFTRGPRKGLTETRWTKEYPGAIWPAIVSHYERKGQTEEHALAQARVARILRSSDYDFKTKEVKPWVPTEDI